MKEEEDILSLYLQFVQSQKPPEYEFEAALADDREQLYED